MLHVSCAYNLSKAGNKELLGLGENPLNRKVQLRAMEITGIKEEHILPPLPPCRKKPACVGLT